MAQDAPRRSSHNGLTLLIIGLPSSGPFALSQTSSVYPSSASPVIARLLSRRLPTRWRRSNLRRRTTTGSSYAVTSNVRPAYPSTLPVG